MKKKLVGIILVSTLAFQLVACGSAETAKAEGVTIKTVTYSDCGKHAYTLKDNGEVDTDVTEYTNGTGNIKIVDAGTIMWTDDQDHIADDVPTTR